MAITAITPSSTIDSRRTLNAKAINAPVKLNLVPEADYAQRFATTVAGGHD